MRILKFTLVFSCMFCMLHVQAQKSPQNFESASKFRLSVGAGTANYYGDLIKKDIGFTQPCFSFSGGLSYALTNKLSARLDVSVQKLRGSDSKKGGAHPERNLNFKSTVFDFSLAGEYTILNLNKSRISPYVSAGVGVMMFNPYTNDASGKRQSLAGLGTEGQGLSGYPDYYNTAALEFPLGVGVKYRVGNSVLLALEFNYRITRTDYLDDVSNNGYVDKAVLDAKNPVTSTFTYRGTGAYPGVNLPRGNPDNNDGFFTTQLKLTFDL